MILRTAGGKAKNGIASCQARRQLGAIEGYLPPHSIGWQGMFTCPRSSFKIIKGFGGFLVVNGLLLGDVNITCQAAE